MHDRMKVKNGRKWLMVG